MEAMVDYGSFLKDINNTFICDYCGCTFTAKPGDKKHSKHKFCCRDHYHEWRRQNSTFDHGDRARDYTKYKRTVWGGSGKTANEVGAWAKPFGATFEKIAINQILPDEGFTEIDSWTNYSNQFIIDIVATKNGKRVLVDVTSKWRAYVPSKVKLAVSLSMDLYILHVSPANPNNYFLNKMNYKHKVSRVPMSVFHNIYDQAKFKIDGWPNKHYHNINKMKQPYPPGGFGICKDTGTLTQEEIDGWE